MTTTVLVANPRSFDMGMYDRQTGKDIVPKKVIDISELCTKEGNNKVLIEYADSVRGPIAQIKIVGEKSDYAVYYFYKEGNVDVLARNLRMTAGVLNIQPKELAKTILENAPTAN